MTSGYITIMRSIQNQILTYIDQSGNDEENYQNLNQEFKENTEYIKDIFYLISNISYNHHQGPFFFKKMEKMLDFLSDDIKKSNPDFLEIFNDKKRIISVLATNEYDTNQKIEDDDNNQNQLLSILQKDSIDDFKEYIEDNKIDLQSEIDPSLFDNYFYLKQSIQTTLIECSAFFGSIEIFQYLLSQDVEINSRIWLYAIHSDKKVLIELLEEKKIEKVPYDELLEEAIKCHHIDIANHFISEIKKLQNPPDQSVNDYEQKRYLYGLRYHNYDFLPDDFDQIGLDQLIFYACKYDYCTIVDYLLKYKKVDLTQKIISPCVYFNIILNWIFL